MIGPTRSRIDEDIGRLDITVDKPGGMGGVQGRSHRGDNRSRARDGQRALPVHQRPYITAGHIPHRDEQHPIRIAGFEHRDDVLVIHCRRRPGFTNEAVPECLIGRQRW